MKYRITEILFFIYISIAFLALDDFFAIQRFKAIGVNTQGNFSIAEYIRQIVFIVEYIIAILSLIYISKLSKKFSLPILVTLSFLILIETSIHKITGRPSDILYISAINGAVGNIYDALKQFDKEIIESLVMTSILMLPLIVRTTLSHLDITSRFNKKGRLPFIFIGVLFVMYTIILIARGTPALMGFPKGYGYGFGSIVLLLNNITQNFQSGEFIKVQPYVGKPLINKIIVVIDESVEYKEFSTLYTQATEHLINYGQAYSGANCSAASNYIIRRATWDKSISSSTLEIKQVDNLFSLAKKQLFRTVYIDNQNVLKDPSVRNYFDDSEIKDINVIIEPNGSYHDIDLNSLSKVESELNNEKVFIFINKVGAHFPYKDTIPPNIIKPNTMENYRNSIKRNAISYLQKLTEIIDDKTVVFYTSDHGQNFGSRSVQCNTGEQTSIAEYSVPFIVITKNHNLSRLFKKAADKYNNLLTHIEFSESIRNAIGYEIDSTFSLFKQSEEFITKYCGLYGQPIPFFGANPSCKKIR